MWTVDRIVDNNVPPIQAPCLCAFRLLSRPAEDARDIVDDLPRAERALGAGARLAVLSEGSLDRVGRNKNHQPGHQNDHHLAPLAEHERRKHDMKTKGKDTTPAQLAS